MESEETDSVGSVSGGEEGDGERGGGPHRDPTIKPPESYTYFFVYFVYIWKHLHTSTKKQFFFFFVHMGVKGGS